MSSERAETYRHGEGALASEAGVGFQEEAE